MRRIILILLLLPLLSDIDGQIIRGQVLDRETREPVGFASIFFHGTFVGCTSDENGVFELDVSRYSSRPLSISAVGYDPDEYSDFTPGKDHLILMKQHSYQIEEVSVTAKSMARKRKLYLRRFREEFLGKSGNAQNCTILNEMDITFNYQSGKDTLRARARKPLLIMNNGLGYYITYHLDQFEYVWKNGDVFFTGSIIFNKDLAVDEASSELYLRRRKNTYAGSRMQFFRTLWSDMLPSTPFIIKNSKNEELRYWHIVELGARGACYLKYEEDLDIYYYSNRSYITFLGEKAYFDGDGFFDPTAIQWGGRMAAQRIADWLPYEYSLRE